MVLLIYLAIKRTTVAVTLGLDLGMKHMSGSSPIGLLGRFTDRTERIVLLCAKKSIQYLFPTRIASEKAVVFVAGVQRSGTNMMMDVLDRSMQTEVFNETDTSAFQAYELKPPSTLQNLIRESRAQTIVFKALCDLQNLKQLLDSFPASKAVWILRRMDDMVNSHCKAHFNKNGPPGRNCNVLMNAIVAKPESCGWRGRGASSETLALLRNCCHSDMSHESAVALFWLMRNRLYFEQDLHRDPRVNVVFYEKFAQAPHDYSRKLFSWLGLRVSRYASRIVNPRSIDRWLQPEIEPPIRALCDELYRRFELEAATVSLDDESAFSDGVISPLTKSAMGDSVPR